LFPIFGRTVNILQLRCPFPESFHLLKIDIYRHKQVLFVVFCVEKYI